MTLHREIEFKNDICRTLAAQGWLHAEGDAARYDKARTLFPADVLAWVQTSQPAPWAQLQKSQGAAAESALLDRLRPEPRRRSKFIRTTRQKLKFAVVTEWRLPDPQGW
jgi:type I restriction enzyme R subunit